MSWVQGALQASWSLMTDDRMALLVGTYFLCVSFPREVAERNAIWSALYLIVGVAMIVIAWRELGRGAP